jgi:hypothetical protein
VTASSPSFQPKSLSSGPLLKRLDLDSVKMRGGLFGTKTAWRLLNGYFQSAQ